MNRKVLSAAMHENCHLGKIGNMNKSINQQTYPGIEMQMVAAGVECSFKNCRFIIPYVNFKILEVEQYAGEDMTGLPRPPRQGERADPELEAKLNAALRMERAERAAQQHPGFPPGHPGLPDQADEIAPPPSGLAAITGAKNQKPGGKK